jgi:hypothetical protein
VFGVDRVMGVSWDRYKIESAAGDTTEKTTNISLFGSSPGLTTNIPRLALDFFVIESVSVGGSLFYLHKSGEVENDAGSADTPSVGIFGFAPRVGYAYAFDETFSLWPRLGLTYMSVSTEDEDGNEGSISAWDLTGEIMFGISPMSNFAILLGPYLDLGLGGTTEATDPVGGGTVESDSTITSYGLTVSIVGYY